MRRGESTKIATIRVELRTQIDFIEYREDEPSVLCKEDVVWMKVSALSTKTRDRWIGK